MIDTAEAVVWTWAVTCLAGVLLAAVVLYPSCTDANTRSQCLRECRGDAACVTVCSGVGR